MKISIATMATVCLAATVFGQGSLAPPGAPAETMKTLEQIEPRIDLATVSGGASEHHFITESGSYYLSADLEVSKNTGIWIWAEDVTLDLNGFKISRVSGSGGYGIEFSSSLSDRATVRNGSISGFDYGIWSVCEGCVIEKLLVSDCDVNGIFAGDLSRFTDCQAHNNQGTGISTGSGSVLSGCIAGFNAGAAGIATHSGSVLTDCSARSNEGIGISAGSGSTLANCSALYNDGAYGIHVNEGGSIRGCTAMFNERDGIHVYGDCQVRDCTSGSNGYGGDGAGIRAEGSGNRIEGCQATDNDRGLDIDGTGNYVANNTVHGNTDNYDFAAGNQLNLLLGEIPETLDWPCSVKLAGTLSCSLAATNGITVNASDVSIDLGGHALVGPGAFSANGIYQASQYRNLAVCNGKVAGWGGTGARAGILANGTGHVFSDLQISTNYYGIYAKTGAVIQTCTVMDNIADGILASTDARISECTVLNNGSSGIVAYYNSTLSGCVANNNADNGISAIYGASISECLANENGNAGIDAGSSSSVTGCSAQDNKMDGILVENECLVRDCTCSGTRTLYPPLGGGIHVTGSGNCIDGNTSTDNANAGIYVTGTGNIVVRNTFSMNTLNYDIVPGNSVGTYQTSPVGAGAWDNFGF